MSATCATASPPIAPIIAPVIPRQAARSAAVILGLLVISSAVVSTIISSTNVVGISSSAGSLLVAPPISIIVDVVIVGAASIVDVAPIAVAIVIAPPAVHTNNKTNGKINKCEERNLLHWRARDAGAFHSWLAALALMRPLVLVFLVAAYLSERKFPAQLMLPIQKHVPGTCQ